MPVEQFDYGYVLTSESRFALYDDEDGGEGQFAYLLYPHEHLDAIIPGLHRAYGRATHRTIFAWPGLDRLMPYALPDPSECEVTYLIRSAGKLKIGRSVRLGLRLNALRTQAASPIEVVSWLEGGHHEESLHEEFKTLRSHGEWFDPHALRVMLGVGNLPSAMTEGEALERSRAILDRAGNALEAS